VLEQGDSLESYRGGIEPGRFKIGKNGIAQIERSLDISFGPVRRVGRVLPIRLRRKRSTMTASDHEESDIRLRLTARIKVTAASLAPSVLKSTVP